MPKKDEYVKLKKFWKKRIKLPFMIYADFEGIVVPEEEGKQNTEKSYSNKYQKYVACIYLWLQIGMLWW